MSNYDIDLIEVSQDLGDGATVFQVTESSQVQGNDIPVDLIIHQGASKTTLEGTITWLWQPGGDGDYAWFCFKCRCERPRLPKQTQILARLQESIWLKVILMIQMTLERGESGDTNIGLIFRGAKPVIRSLIMKIYRALQT